MQSNFSTNSIELRIRINIEFIVDFTRCQKVISRNILYIDNIYLFTIVSNNTIVRTISNINYNIGSIYNRQTIEYNIDCVIFSIIVDFENVLIEIVKRVVVLL